MEFILNDTGIRATPGLTTTVPFSQLPSDAIGVDVTFSYGERVVLAVAICLIAVFGGFGNGLVIISVALSRKLRTATNVYVVSLSTTDLLTCLCLPWHALAVASVDGWPMDMVVCATAGALSIIFVGSSMITLAFIALNRLYLITQPSAKYRAFYTSKMLIATTLLAWLLPIATVAIPPLVGLGKLGYDDKYLRCGPLHKSKNSFSVYDSIIATVLYPAPLVIIVVSYVKIFLHIRRHTKTITAPNEHSSSSHYPKSPAVSNGNNHPQTPALKPQSSTKKRLSRRQVEITKNLFYVVCAFVLCLTPYSTGLMIPGLDHFVPYAGVILLLNSCVNPVIYAAKHPHFKTVFRYILTLKFSKIPEPSNFLRSALSSRSDLPSK
ncbi:melatonin receptor type 1B-A-like [Asterias rubens]|uniref:melatonin receptor type 1B-A-like n=1 Tax=Asterias rubens TaxID=7604 RepID=UPI001455D840|nr:melatonin receptor type 1B-A-like [Asterias rubens]